MNIKFNDKLKIGKSLLILASLWLIAPFDAGAAGTYLVNENFNAMAADLIPGSPWSVVSTGGGSVLVKEVPFLQNKSVRIQKLNASGASELSQTFTNQTGRIVFEAKLMSRETAGFKAIPYIYNDAGNTVASVKFQDGNIMANAAGTWTVVQSFKANVWYLVRLVADTTNGVFDLYIDGVRKLRGQGLRTPSSSVNKFSYFMDGTNTGTFYVDNVRVYTEASYIGAAPSPVFDARSYGAVGDGTTDDTNAIQSAINACGGTGGSVLLAGGTFLSGTLVMKSNMTFFVDASATLLGKSVNTAYPVQIPGTGNTQLNNCKRALIYAPNATQLKIDGGGTLDGQGDSFSGPEGDRPILIWAVLSNNVTIQNLYLKKGAVWSLVSMESDNVLINNVNIQSNYITHDGIDLVDGQGITVQNCAATSGDDAMCLKTGIRRGLDSVTVKDSVFAGDNGGSNGIKFGTGSYGKFTNITIQDCYVKNVQYAAMAVESRQGADVDNIAFQRVHFADAGSAFFVYLAQQNTVAPAGDVPKLGSMNHVSFTDIDGWTKSWANSPAQGSLITGHLYNGTTYYISNLSFTSATVTLIGGRTTVPGNPPEAIPNQYPESNMFGDLPAWAFYLRHVNGVTFNSSSFSLAMSDVRQEKVLADSQLGATTLPPVFDGYKDPVWSTPIAASGGYKLPDDRARDLYVLSDTFYLYIGFPFSGDPWADGLSAHYNLLIDTGTSGGVATDPWRNTTSVNWVNKPDIAVNGWINGTSAASFGGMTLYRAQGSAWDAGAALVSGRDFFADKNNNWAELRIPQNVLGISPGQTIQMVLIFRPAENKPGVSDSTPFDGASGACNDYGNSNSVLSQFVTYKFPVNGGSQPAPAFHPTAALGAITTDLASFIVFPNPFRPNSGDPQTGREYSPQDSGSGIIFDNVSESAEAKIYTLTGERVSTIKAAPGSSRIRWDAKNEGGNPVASGFYFYLVQDPAGRKLTGKIAVIR